METVRAMETIKRLEVGLDSGLLYFHTELLFDFLI